MTADPTPAPNPVVRSCRDVIGAAGHVTAALLSAYPDPRDALDTVKRVNPALAEPLTLLLDSVTELDFRTGFMQGQGPLPDVQPFA